MRMTFGYPVSTSRLASAIPYLQHKISIPFTASSPYTLPFFARGIYINKKRFSPKETTNLSNETIQIMEWHATLHWRFGLLFHFGLRGFPSDIC